MPSTIIIIGIVGLACLLFAVFMGSSIYLLANLWWVIGLVALVGLYFGWRMNAVEDEYHF